jgi:hypothetical protein
LIDLEKKGGNEDNIGGVGSGNNLGARASIVMGGRRQQKSGGGMLSMIPFISSCATVRDLSWNNSINRV